MVMREIGVGIIGFGTIGAGVADVLLRNDKEIQARLGTKLKLVKIADLDIESDRGVEVENQEKTWITEGLVGVAMHVLFGFLRSLQFYARIWDA